MRAYAAACFGASPLPLQLQWTLPAGHLLSLSSAFLPSLSAHLLTASRSLLCGPASTPPHASNKQAQEQAPPPLQPWRAEDAAAPDVIMAPASFTTTYAEVVARSMPATLLARDVDRGMSPPAGAKSTRDGAPAPASRRSSTDSTQLLVGLIAQQEELEGEQQEGSQDLDTEGEGGGEDDVTEPNYCHVMPALEEPERWRWGGGQAGGLLHQQQQELSAAEEEEEEEGEEEEYVLV